MIRSTLTRFLGNLPIKRKLTVITMLTSSIALLLACAAFVIYEQATFRQSLARDFAILADMFDDNAAPGLAFNDADSIEKTLQTLSAHKHILVACVFDKAGKSVARYDRPDLKTKPTLPPARRTSSVFLPDRLDTFQDITLAGEFIGTVYIGTDLLEITGRLHRYGIIAGLVMVVALLVAFGLSSGLQQVISEPVLNLSKAAYRVATEKDYGVRVVKQGDDELGRLIDGFNEMLNQIQARDGALQEAHADLEKRVVERTQELLQENIERQRAESFLNSVLLNLPIMVFIKEPKDLRFVLWNKAGEKLTGFTQEELLNKNDYDFFPKEQADLFAAKDREALSGGRQIEIEEEILTRHQGPRILRTRKIPILDKDGKPLYLLGISEDITERKRAEVELENIHKQLLETSRQAGMAEVATGVLHNVGNALNSVNVSSTLVADNLKRSKAANLSKVVVMFREHAADLGTFMNSDPKGRQIPGYLAQLTEHLASEQAAGLKELALLQKNIEHIKDIVAMQQSYAKVSGVTETLKVTDLVEDALRMNASALDRHQVKAIREFTDVPLITVEKQKVLQILINLIRNAKYACDEGGRPDKQMTLRVTNGDDRIRISVIDNGVGIPAENLMRIFNHGFTTRKEGHGFGLHSGALAAKELGGSLLVHSDGVGLGATFTVELPLQPPGRNHV